MNIPMDKIVGLTLRQREYLEAIEQNTEGVTFISTGICPGCKTCYDDFAMEVNCSCENTQDELPYCLDCRDTTYRKPTMEEFEEQWSTGEIFDEGHFSWSGCDLCGSPLGGNFEAWHAIDENGEIVHGERACVDCVMYFANGDLPE